MEIDEGFEAFRARYPSARDALAECENAIWVVRIAFDAAKDKKSIIRAAFWIRERDERPWDAAATFLTPLPERYAALERWSGERTEEDEGTEGREWSNVRAASLPVMAGWILWILVATAHLWTSLEWHRTLVATMIAVGVVVGGFWLLKRWARQILRAQIARLNADPNKALTIALRRLTNVAKQDPGKMEREIWWLRRQCLEVLDREAAIL